MGWADEQMGRWVDGCHVARLPGLKRLVVWLFGCLVVWLFGCLVVWLFGCLVGLVVWLVWFDLLS